MDFIERWLHINPDGGSGVLEAIYLGTALVIVAGVVLLRHFVTRRRRGDDQA